MPIWKCQLMAHHIPIDSVAVLAQALIFAQALTCIPVPVMRCLVLAMLLGLGHCVKSKFPELPVKDELEKLPELPVKDELVEIPSSQSSRSVPSRRFPSTSASSSSNRMPECPAQHQHQNQHLDYMSWEVDMNPALPGEPVPQPRPRKRARLEPQSRARPAPSKPFVPPDIVASQSPMFVPSDSGEIAPCTPQCSVQAKTESPQTVQPRGTPSPGPHLWLTHLYNEIPENPADQQAEPGPEPCI